MRALARVDLGAIERNCARLAAVAAPAALCAVVKADGYGHGAVAGRARGAGGRRELAGRGDGARRRAGCARRASTGPLLVMGALSPEELEVALAARADVVAWREAFVGAALRGRARGVHVKLDTRHGAARHARPRGGDARRRGRRGRAGLRLAGAMTHFATADDDPAFVREQLARFTPWAEALKAAHPGRARPRRQLGRHAARAGGALRHGPLRHRDLRHGPVPRGPGRARPRAGARAASPTSPRSSRARPARAPATAGASSPSAPTLARHAADRLRATACAAR